MPKKRTNLGKASSKANKPICIDIYCGAGGSTFGAAEAGLDVVYGVDRDQNAIDTFAKNHPDAYADCRDIASVTAKEIMDLSGASEIDYLLSGPNCQAVSQMGLFWSDDPRNLMFVHLARILDEFISIGKAPKNVIVENVASIAFKKNIHIVRDLLSFFTDRGYKCASDVVNFATWGLPQLRHRFILIATRSEKEPSLPCPVADLETGKGLVTAWDAIGDLSAADPVSVGMEVRLNGKPTSAFQKLMRSSSKMVSNHHAGRTADIDIERIKRVPPGGSWKDIPERLLPARFKKVRMTDYKTLYGRILKDHPSYTIYSAYGNVTSGCFTHPVHDRPLTVREGCRLQGFPDNFVVCGSIPSQYRQIGNAVPAYASKHLIEHWEKVLRSEVVDTVPMRLTLDKLSEEPLRLPVLVPRYTRIGYGAGTYWPKGWGDKPADLPTGSMDYRISTEPINYRRTKWRDKRDQMMSGSIEAIQSIDWSDFLAALDREEPLMLLLNGIDTSLSATQTNKDLARQRFMNFLAPAGGAIVEIARSRGRLDVHCDFGLTAGWLQKFLGYLIDHAKEPIRVTNDDVGHQVGSEAANIQVRLLTGKVSDLHGSSIVFAHPFTGVNGFGEMKSRSLPFPISDIKATLLTGTDPS